MRRRRVVAVERGEATDVPVGRLDIVRDFLDVRDGVEAIEVVAARGKAGDVYNICSGRPTRISDVLDGYRAIAKTAFRERADSALMRPIDELVKVGDPGKLMTLGWSARHTLQESLAAVLEYWRDQPMTAFEQ
jgi:GDP-4-dehydro-6-deoxy-D-mannose reductase